MSEEIEKTDHSESTACCPRFDSTPWDGSTHQWEDKLFIKDSIRQIFHIPMPSSITRTIQRMWAKATKVNANLDAKDFLLLAYDPSPWKCEYYMAVAKEVPEADNVKISGTFFSKVFDGPYSAVPKWIKEMEEVLHSQGKKSKKYYFYYTTCPKCAKLYGHNYVVAFAESE